MRPRFEERIGRLVDVFCIRPWRTIGLAALLFVSFAAIASRLELHSDLLELLPRDSPSFRAFEHQLGRIGGRSTLLVIVKSEDKNANEGAVTAIADRLEAARTSSPDIATLVAYVESDTKDVRAFYENEKWLYADIADLREADGELDRQIALRSGIALDDDDDATTTSNASTTPSPTAKEESKPALGMQTYLDRWKKKSSDKDAFPAGYFETADGKLAGLRIVTNVGLGDARGDRLLDAVKAQIAELRMQPNFPANVEIGFTGDIASAADEKRALVGEAAYATLLAVSIVLVAIVLYYRSLTSLVVIALPVALGVAAAYAFAEVAFGYVNTSGAFLGAIIVGNGINYPIVLLSRYQEFRARGMPPDEARRSAVTNAFRAELVGAFVAAIAYGSLSLTRFRGFSQFGAIGFVGMISVWIAIVPLVPATLVVLEKISLPRWLRDRPAPVTSEGARPIANAFATIVTKHPWPFVIGGLLLTAAAASRIPAYAHDPWEYDFGKLGSKKTEVSGAGEWSNRANDVFGGKANIAGATMLADTPEQVPLVKAQILANDARDPQGRMIADVTTLTDMLPGTAAQQLEKLAVLDDIREHLTPHVMAEVSADERTTLDEARPPESLHVLAPQDLPAFVKRRFTDNAGRLGIVFYVKPRDGIVFADGHNHLRLAATTDDVRLPDGTIVETASRSTIFAEILRSMRRDAPLSSLAALLGVVAVVSLATRRVSLALPVLAALAIAATWLCGWAAVTGARINYVSFIAFPITLGIGAEYPFNLADRVRLLGGDVAAAIRRSAGAVLLCSFTTMVGYGSLLVSDFQALASFGKLAVVGEIASIAAAVLVMPSCIVLVRRIRSRA